jgi:hypothetical protein
MRTCLKISKGGTVIMGAPDITNKAGVILTIGMEGNGDRVEIAIPMGIDPESIDAVKMCEDAVTSFIGGPIEDFLGMLVTGAHITFVAAEGMYNGRVPYREDYAATVYQGTATGAAVSSQVALLLSFYEDVGDESPGARIRVGKSFIPFGPATDIVAGRWNPTAVAAGMLFVNDCLNGWDSVEFDGSKWYRYLATPKTRNVETDVKKIISGECRAYPSTQRRRLTPH